MRSRKLFVALTVALVVVAVVAFYPLFGDQVCVDQFDRIKLGMSRAQVEAILGQPGDYTSGPTKPINAPGPTDPPILSERAADYAEHGPPPTDYSTWEGDTGQILIRYGPQGVWLKQWWPSDPEKRSFLNRLQGRFERRWNRWFPDRER